MVMHMYPDDRALSTSLGHPSKRLMSHMQCFENNDLFIATFSCAAEINPHTRQMFIFVDALTHLMFVKILVFKQFPLPDRMKTASSPVPLCSAPAMLYRPLPPLQRICKRFQLQRKAGNRPSLVLSGLADGRSTNL